MTMQNLKDLIEAASETMLTLQANHGRAMHK